MWSEVPLTASDTHLLQLNKSGVGVAFTSRKGCNSGLRKREGRGGEEGRREWRGEPFTKRRCSDHNQAVSEGVVVAPLQ